MKKRINTLLIVLMLLSVLLLIVMKTFTSAKHDGESIENGETTRKQEKTDISEKTTAQTGTESTGSKGTGSVEKEIDIYKIKPDENGKIIVVMFHDFVKSFTPKKYDKGEYTTTFDDFRKLLEMLYDKGYRLISLEDYLNDSITVGAGLIPMIFTFDDGASSQFNMVEDNGRLVVNRQSAVGIMEEFNKTHPDFGMKGTFYINLGGNPFNGKGTVAQRLNCLIGMGFEIGNHTLNHVYLGRFKDTGAIQREIGGNQKKMEELVPGYKMKSLSLPYGQAPVELKNYLAGGVYEGVEYKNLAIMEVGAEPALSPIDKKYNPLVTRRVRASGIKPVEYDLAWWLEHLTIGEQYISDGNSGTITIPKSEEPNVDMEKLKSKKLVVY